MIAQNNDDESEQQDTNSSVACDVTRPSCRRKKRASQKQEGLQQEPGRDAAESDE